MTLIIIQFFLLLYLHLLFQKKSNKNKQHKKWELTLTFSLHKLYIEVLFILF